MSIFPLLFGWPFGSRLFCRHPQARQVHMGRLIVHLGISYIINEYIDEWMQGHGSPS